MFTRFAGPGAWTVLGLMSGTSLDGLDAARVRLERGDGGLAGWKLLEYQELPYPPVLRGEMEALVRGEERDAATFTRLHVGLARAFAEFVALAFGSPADGSVADLAAFPGQTLFHDPAAGLSLQIGSPAAFAALTGLDTVGEFRLPDMLAGGQGAPLVPLADALLHRDLVEYRVLVNLGGIANLTLLPPGRGAGDVRAWDTGPGNVLLDQAARLGLGAERDEGGAAAASGAVREGRLQEWLAHPWFHRRPPKSTGRELFGRAFLGLADLRRELDVMGPDDLLATLTELTVESVAQAVPTGEADRVYVAGGGARNDTLLRRLRERLAPLPVAPMEALGLPAEAKEAVDFAVLALEAAAGRPVALPAVTGAKRAATAGLFCPGRPAAATEP
ncbi:MAG: anhydro-N-acetylmuramic acid kinase [Candidatus Krumholzibacteriota bacterium]|nr:anhydro-N-acetylmuramic acid kinase [Candidatus Krumholzibacteriota bacterium]